MKPQIWPDLAWQAQENMPKANFPPGLPQGHPDFGGPAPKRRPQKGAKKKPEMKRKWMQKPGRRPAGCRPSRPLV